MRISSIGIPFYNSLKSYKYSNKVVLSAPKTQGADIFCFKGNKDFSENVGIILSSNPSDLEKNIQKKLRINPIETQVKKFQNGETYVNITGSVRGKDVYIMPSNGVNVNDNLIETYLKADAAKRSGAKKVIAVLPSFDYARQEKRTEKGEPIAARLNMDLLKTSGVDEIITSDLHTPALEGFASNSLCINSLDSMDTLKDYIESLNISDLMIVSPDLGGTKRVDKLAKALGCDKAIIYKHRQAHNEATAEDLIGDVTGKNCILYDDMIDTAGTIVEAVKLLKRKGANDVYVCAAHGFLNGKAMERLANLPVKQVIVTNSVPKKPNTIDKIKQVDISTQIVEVMKNISA